MKTTILLVLLIALLTFFMLGCIEPRDDDGQSPIVNTTENAAGKVGGAMLDVLEWGHEYDKEGDR